MAVYIKHQPVHPQCIYAYNEVESCTETQPPHLCAVSLPVMDKLGIRSNIIKIMDDSYSE